MPLLDPHITFIPKKLGERPRPLAHPVPIAPEHPHILEQIREATHPACRALRHAVALLYSPFHASSASAFASAAASVAAAASVTAPAPASAAASVTAAASAPVSSTGAAREKSSPWRANP